FGNDFFYFGDHAFHHAFDTGFQRDHGGGTAGAGTLKHQVDDTLVIAFELDSAAVHFHGRLNVVFQQLFNAFDDIVIIRVDSVAFFSDDDDLVFVDHGLA